MLKRLVRFMSSMDQFRIVQEGRATVLAPKEDKVFYNPIQQFNRDLSVMAIQAWLQEHKQSKVGKRELQRAERPLKKMKLEEKDAEKKETQPEKEGTQPEKEETQPEKEETQLENSGKASESTEDGESHAKAAAGENADGGARFVRILEALSATGLRAIRYGHEVPQVSRVVANDLLPAAVESITRSVAHNGLSHLVQAHQGDAIRYMALGEQFHVVDLDPYGTAAPFLDSAIQSVRDGGLLLVTCTDAGVLAGSGYPEKCFALYGGNNLGSAAALEANHEAGLRLILGAIAAAGARHKKAIEPVLSLSVDYYFRVFVRVRASGLAVKQLASETMLAYHCVGCGNIVEQRMGRAGKGKFHTPRVTFEGKAREAKEEIREESQQSQQKENTLAKQRKKQDDEETHFSGGLCGFCSRPHHLAGPMWGGELHSASFIDRVLAINAAALPETYATRERIRGMLTLARSELRAPFYVSLNQMLSFFRAPPIPIDEFARAAGNMGHEVSLTHAKKNCVKTSAPWSHVLAIFVAWLRRSNTRRLQELQTLLELEQDSEKRARLEEKIAKLSADLGASANLTPGMVGAALLRTAPRLDVDFDTANDQSARLAQLRRLKMVRYQENPTKNWGPMARPGGKND